MTVPPRMPAAVLAALAVLAAGCAAPLTTPAARSTSAAPATALRAQVAAAPKACAGPVVIGHRGAPATAPENTMASFEAALRGGADWLETDVQTTSDGVPVLMHDSSVDRVTDGKGEVAALTAAQIAGLRVTIGPGGPEPVPTLELLLARLAGTRTRLLMEIKWQRPEDVARIARIAAASRADVVLYSFSAAHLKQAHEEAPRLPLVLIQGGGLADPPDGLPLAGLALDAGLATAERIGAERRAGHQVYVWTLDDEPSWQAMSDRDAAGLITDVPDRARAWADGRCRAPGSGPPAPGGDR
ncbi:glycerophosphodiester phosphodiesterase [Kitasatospora sp. NBC_00240]|uniref:glycerophosphodiester phosphodiesterase n=1 Tax=Kitasatospora sp. NBC_00240 TaxID=2903567 RepID=UPI002256529E|nr:glycerophosphodiester phosphodiesterase [Kitasatospora sp. NBC_00240]MCX5212213.1 glycerophosphodiester phosphodiesterase [Kitasatospora sp. NBC_00240]